MNHASDTEEGGSKRHIRVGNRKLPVPRSRAGRLSLGIALVIGGTLGFLPIVGFWMIPLGLLVLSRDVPAARRLVRSGRRFVLRVMRKWRER